MPSPSSKAPGGAHSLVSVEGGRLVVHEHAAAVLSSAAAFRAPLAVLAVTGSARCGKSFLLNQLLGRADGFPTSAGVRACTRTCTCAYARTRVRTYVRMRVRAYTRTRVRSYAR